jgi:hypothetical protein
MRRELAPALLSTRLPTPTRVGQAACALFGGPATHLNANSLQLAGQGPDTVRVEQMWN